MIGKLTGFIDAIYEDKAVIDVAGVGYVVFLSSKTLNFLSKFPREKKISLTIETVVKEEKIELYGFVNEIEKVWFLELTKVQGVGAKMAQKILGFFEIEDIAKSLLSSDSKAFTQISGIGPKLASRIVTELKDSPKKLGSAVDFDAKNFVDAGKILKNQISADTLSALENLGYKKHECLKVIDHFFSLDSKVTLENLITLCLRELSKNKL